MTSNRIVYPMTLNTKGHHKIAKGEIISEVVENETKKVQVVEILSFTPTEIKLMVIDITK